MKNSLALVIVALVATLGFAGTGGIAGRVTDVVTGEPVANAMVIACSDSTPAGRAVTSDHGFYLIQGLEPGRYRVSARAHGYAPAHPPVFVVVQAGEVTRGVNLRLRPLPARTGGISGRVVDRISGRPIPGAVVVAIGNTSRRRVRTDRNGFYLIRGVPAGRYQVGARARRYFGAVYPEPVEVRPGEVTENVNFALQPKPRPGGIAGQVVNARTGYPVAGALVVARGDAGESFARTDGHGFYRIGNLSPGTYRVSVAKPGYQPATYPQAVEVSPGEVTRGIDFRLEPRRTDVYESD